MKYTLPFSLFLLFYGVCHAQNLVPNPSFEEYDACPNGLSQISRALGWYSAKPTPDYFNTCALSGNSSVPDNFWGRQIPASGNAYAGFAAMYGGASNLNEYIGIKLIDSLNIGVQYYISFKISRAFNPNFQNDCSVNKIGALFSSIQYSDTNNAPICDCSQVFTNVIITDSINWTMVKGAFIADSSYQYINIGNFFTESSTDFILRQGSFCNAYYYLDDVCVSSDSTYAYTYATTSTTKKEERITYFPNPFKDFVTLKSEESNIEHVKIYNMIGALFRTYDIETTQSYVFDLSDIPPGNYFIVIHLKNSKFSKFTITKS